MRLFIIKSILAIGSIIIAFFIWLIFNIFIESTGLVSFSNKIFSRFTFIGGSLLGFLSILIYYIFNVIALPSEKTTSDKGSVKAQLGFFFISILIAAISVLIGNALWKGLIYITLHIISRDIAFSISQFGLMGWLLFSLLCIVIFSLITKIAKKTKLNL